MSSVGSRPELLSVVIPCHNEDEAIGATVRAITRELDAHEIPHEIVCVNDHSTDRTAAVLDALNAEDSRWRSVSNERAGGFGLAVRAGINSIQGDVVAIMMADASDDPADLVAYYRQISSGYDCAFGTRWHRSSVVSGYPVMKLLINRLVNHTIRLLFWLSYDDVTNAFKCYRRSTLDGLRPFLSHHFNLTVELPLKAIVRGYSYSVVPINWYGRTTGISKLKLKEMGSRYLFIILYAWIERVLSRGDYHSSKTRRLTSLAARDSTDGLDVPVAHRE
jgi:dolichol-phosphate mannosyltransferase